MKKIIQACCLLLLTTSIFAENNIIVYSNDGASYSFAFTPNRCFGNFDFNHNLSISLSKIDNEACRDGVCSIFLYGNVNCAPNNVIATGYFDIKTGKTTFNNKDPHLYIFTGDNYYIGVETKRPHC